MKSKKISIKGNTFEEDSIFIIVLPNCISRVEVMMKKTLTSYSVAADEMFLKYL